MTYATIEDARFVTIDRRRPLVDLVTRHEPTLGVAGLLMILMMPPTLFAAMIDGRVFQDESVWMKPFKFEVALAIYLLTLAFYARWLPDGLRRRRWYRVFIGAVVAAVLAEMVWIGGAAALGTSSHFNPTAFGSIIYPLMGVAAVVLTSASAVLAWQIRANERLRLPPAFRESLVIGLALVLPLTLVTAGTMSSYGSHLVGGADGTTSGLALMGWSREVGDLRVAHFFATHALHIVPAFGVLSAWLLGGDNRLPVRVFSAVFVAFVLYTFIEALAGRPFLPLIG